MGIMENFEVNLPSARVFTNGLVHTQMDKNFFNTLWVSLKENTTGAQSFNLPLLNDLESLVTKIKGDDQWYQDNDFNQIQYAVTKSEHADYFSSGGDLTYFRRCIDQRDAESLFSYSKLCLDILYNWSTLNKQGITTIALVQGRALGGGFETALSSDFIIAEEQSMFGFPEIMFGLFPCTGGMSLLARRVGVYEAERMMTNGRLYTASELKAMGVIDQVCAKGQGEQAVEKFIKAHAKHYRARVMLQRSRHRLAPIDYSELLTVVHEWVAIAMELQPEELRAMDMLINMQNRPAEIMPIAA